MKSAAILLFLLALTTGCEKHFIVRHVAHSENEKEFDNICRRIANLDMTVITPGSGILISSALKMRKLIKLYGLNIPDSALVNNYILDGADSDDNKLNKVIDAINSSHKIIWAMRGGYGTSRLIGTLNTLPTPRMNKTLIGFSDITSMNLFVSQKWPNWRVIHAPVLTFLNIEDFSKNKFDTLLSILEGKINSYDISRIFPLNDKAKNLKSVTGKLTGGNLTIIESSLKTCWEIETDGKILFIEDIYEEPKQIYRSLYHLKEAGKLSNIKALIFGHFHKVKEVEKLRLYLTAFSRIISTPVYITDQFGHGANNMPLIYNATASIHDNKMTVDCSANN